MKKRVFSLIASVAVLLSLTLIASGCLRASLKKDNVVTRLREEGYTISYETTTRMIAEGKADHDFTDIICAKSGEEIVYVYFCGDLSTAKWTEKLAESYSDPAVEKPAHYRNDKTVMWGTVAAVTAARGY